MAEYRKMSWEVSKKSLKPMVLSDGDNSDIGSIKCQPGRPVNIKSLAQFSLYLTDEETETQETSGKYETYLESHTHVAPDRRLAHAQACPLSTSAWYPGML